MTRFPVRWIQAVTTVVMLVGANSHVRADTPTAEAVLAEAQVTAKAEKKAILVHFSASWCSWCRRLEAFMHDPAIAPIFERHFVMVRLVVRERDPNKALDNPGGMDVLARFGGADRGIPYTVMLGADGTMLANSLMKSEDATAKDGVDNLGYPGEPESIAHFLGMLQTAAPGLTADERQTLEDWLVAHQPKEG